MKVYKTSYKSPEFTILPLDGSDILTSSPGTETPIVDEGGEWRENG